MKKNLILLMVITVLLIEQTVGDTEDIRTSSNEKTFRNAIKAQLATLSEVPITLGKQLLEDAYADTPNIENASTVLAEALEDLEELKPYTAENKIKAFLSLSFIFDIVSGRVSINDDEERKGDLLTLKEVLERQGYNGVAREFQQRFDEFLVWLTHEQLRVKALKKLFLRFKEETNFSKKKDFLQAIASRVK